MPCQQNTNLPQVKCDGRPNGCRNCERLHLTCVDDSSSTATLPLTLGSIRTYRSCTNCRSSKTKCNGDRPRCSRCVARSMDCVYVGGSVPRWASTIEGPYSRRTSSAEAGSLPRSGAGASSNHSSSPPERPQPDRQDSSGNDHAMEDRDAGAAPPTDGSDPAASAPSSAPPAPAVAQAPSPPRPLHYHAEAPMMPPISTIAPIAALPPKTPITPSQPQNSLEVGAMAW